MAIVVVGTLAFVATGFNRVSVAQLERSEFLSTSGRGSFTNRLAEPLARLFESRFGPSLRFLMPFLLLAGVYVPLRRALDEVAWQVRTRAAVHQAIAAAGLPARTAGDREQPAGCDATHGPNVLLHVQSSDHLLGDGSPGEALPSQRGSVLGQVPRELLKA